MKTKGKKLYVIIPLLACCILTAVYCLFFILLEDRKAPIIEMTSDTVTVSVRDGQSALMKGVSATDDKDGDVTDSIIIEKISAFTQDKKATVTYVAYDSVGNASKASRTVVFTDYQPPKFGQTKALVFASNTSPDVLSFMTAEDKIDGDISNRVKGTLLSQATSLSYPGEHIIEFRVTNSMGDTRRITLPVDVYQPQEYNARVDLTDYLVYVKAGEEFNPQRYMYSLVVGSNEYLLDPVANPEIKLYTNNYVSPAVNPSATIVNATVKSDVDTAKPGVYSVTYTVDYDGRYTGFTRLNVVVEE